MIQQMDVFLQSETNSFVEMLFKVVDTKEYLNPAPAKESVATEEAEPAKAVVEETEPKVEADSTTPIREYEKYDVRTPSYEERKRFRSSPPRERRLSSRLGARDIREPPPRRYRSRSRSFSPRHDRYRSSRRRSRSPLMDRRRRSPEGLVRRGRSLDRERNNSRDSTPTRDEGATGYTPTAKKPRYTIEEVLTENLLFIQSPFPNRCRDYDEKGFCLKGDHCKFDHGTGNLEKSELETGLILHFF